jgi:diacylglycerol O-acyltransferase / trehalose O-mycolyltransferase
MKTLPLGCSAPLRSAGALVVARRGSAIAAGLLVTLAVQASVPALETVSATPVTYAAAPGLVIPRTTEYLLDNAAVGNGQTKVRVLLPVGYEAGQDYPVVYLLHGFSGSEGTWSNMNAANNINDTLETNTRAANIVFVMPDGDNDFYSDWYEPTAGGTMRNWETYHIEQLIPWVEANFKVCRDRGGRAISGLSMGGFGCLTYATRHPDLFAGVFAISGAVNNIPLSLVGALDQVPEELLALVNLPAVLNIDPAQIWGPFLSQAVLWHGRNPFTLMNNLRPLKVWYATGLGLGSDMPGDNQTTRAMEAAVGALNYEFNLKMLALDIPHTFHVNPQATHTGYYFLQWFKQALPVMEQTFAANAGTPASFDYQAIESSFDIFGWNFGTDRDVVEFLYLTDVSRDGLTLQGSGVVSVTTPPVYAPGSLHWVVAPPELGIDVWPNWPRADAQGRLHFNVKLGNSHQAQQFTVGAVLVDDWKKTRVNIH